MSDLELANIDNCIDLALTEDGSQLRRDDGLETAVIISLFTDMRLAAAELPPGETKLKGWWGNQFLPNVGDQYGSRIWAFFRGKVDASTASGIQVRAKQALQWMIDDGVASTVEVTTSLEASQIVVNISISRPEDDSENIYQFFWDGQSVRR